MKLLSSNSRCPVRVVAPSLFVVGIACATAALGQALPETQAGTGSYCGPYRIGHINGVRATQVDAAQNLEALSISYGRYRGDRRLKYFLAYNPTGGLPGDLPEVLAQKEQEFPGATIVQMLRFLLYSETGTLASELVNQLATLYADWINGSGRSFNTYSDASLQTIINYVTTSASNGTRVLLVPHSQGNLYANRVVEVLTSGQAPFDGWRQYKYGSIGIVGLATPAAYVAGQRAENKGYVTSLNDIVIGGLRKAGYAVLAPNVTVPFTQDDFTGHGFREIYLAKPEAWTVAKQKVDSVLDALLAPNRASEAAVSYDEAVVTYPAPGRPKILRDGRIFTTPFFSYIDEQGRRTYASGEIETAREVMRGVVRTCTSRALAAVKYGEAMDLDPNYADPEGLGQCWGLEWRFGIHIAARHDDIISVEGEQWTSYPWGETSVSFNIWQEGTCRQS